MPAYWNCWAKALCPMLGRGLYEISQIHSYWLLKCIILKYVCLESAFVHYEEWCTLHVQHSNQFKLYPFKTNNKEKTFTTVGQNAYGCLGNSCSFFILCSWGYRGREADMGSVSAMDRFYIADSFQQRQMLAVQIAPTAMGSLLCLRSLNTSTIHLNSQVQSRSF